ncbi:MAG: cob(I)yrinic acid a,c-diamide adenosyltransferase [Candidatus Scalindua sp. AMX11]|nr:MAG: cob(I)yrinic acid a,c-diamide adenosyltransferase [Candidatus Scalindua sp.]NOG86073.1 cob(I)yrinic acid a,c-diamide adenosyltransferase [Planctomycetota bacterium]RZV98841.1 MAG: cob(I)yrinic acid a,c-diamide adenosyltransferase [Candidatus Scalindua sp. SCAELEC01]TDE66969.1 MAG: cob(I)yrinic acid a,c-diamide adenosyltransferase [Candidatus Scalindua sp. AMX11]GJQ57777.1 MAG: cob(I)alamin adenosyltransferase/cobinamide ATP-dependent adenosyltransferase [Candidatus Scalindua sp.]
MHVNSILKCYFNKKDLQNNRLCDFIGDTLDKGLLIIYTGNGKGKTTAAIGSAIRAVGQGLKVIMLQFIKGSWKYGELESLKRLKPDFEIQPLGKGFVGANSKLGEEEVQGNISKSWERAKEAIASDRYDMVILDEVNYVIDYGLLPVEEVVTVLEKRPKRLHVIMTGRNVHERVVEKADLVTEMREIKHPYSQGIKAQKGIEF